MRLEIGPGKRPLARLPDDQCARVDADPQSPLCAYRAHWGTDRLPFKGPIFDDVYASHVIEHVAWYSVPAALAEARRVMVDGGRIEIWTMDMAALARAYLAGECGDRWRWGNESGDPMRWLNGRLFAAGPAHHHHHAVFDAPYLQRLLEGAGFVRVRRLEERTRGISHGPCEFGMEGYK